MYKYALTGHTQGLGVEIKNLLPANTKCFSRSNNYDISKQADRLKIINESVDCDVFINNAYHKFAQVELLYELINSWENKEKCIINIGSNITNYESETFNFKRMVHKTHKLSLLQAVNEINKYNMRLKVIYFNIVGYLGTQKMINKYPNISFLSTKKVANDIVKAAHPSC